MKSIHLLMIFNLSILFLLSACEVTPSTDNNWHLPLIETHNKLWEHRYKQANKSVNIEKKLLFSSEHPKLVAWRKDLNKLKGLPQIKQLSGVNALVNKDVKYLNDYNHYGKNDVWGFPIETLEQGGDCEDYAFLKAVSLQYLGWSDQQFSIIVGKYTGKTPGLHAVLMVTLENGGEVILDNMYVNLMTPNLEWFFVPLYVITSTHFYQVEPSFIHDKTLFNKTI